LQAITGMLVEVYWWDAIAPSGHCAMILPTGSTLESGQEFWWLRAINH
jgi:hypothetical protein